MKEFKEYFSLQELQTLLNSENKYDEMEPLYHALDKFLTENNLVKPFTNHNTHRTNFGFYWENYIAGTIEDYQKNRMLGDVIDKFVFMRIFYEEDVHKAYEKLNDKINQGNFQPFDLGDMFYDFESGENFKLAVKNWQPSLVKYIPGETLTSPGRFELAKEELVQKVIEGQIEFKTGNLIVADWFKIKEFTDTVDKDNNFDVNCEKGRIEQAQYYLDKFNFIHTATWNSSDLYQKGDTFVFTSFDEDFECPKGYLEKGHVDKELRALSIIEKEHLVEIVGSPKKVDEYLNKKPYGVLELKVTPGTYTFTMASAPEFIRREYNNLESAQTEENRAEISCLLENKHFKPVLLMQGLELSPKKKLKVK